MTALGSPEVALQAVTTGAGHLASDRTARNAAAVMAVIGDRATPVTQGAAGPLVRERLIASILDLETGLDRERPDLPAVDIAPSTTSAEMIADLAISVRGLTVVTTGPLTNLALALRNRTGVESGIERVVALGGAWGLGNKTAAAEWNILCDPEAAAIVFSAGVPVTLVPIDAAAQVVIDDSLVSRGGVDGRHFWRVSRASSCGRYVRRIGQASSARLKRRSMIRSPYWRPRRRR